MTKIRLCESFIVVLAIGFPGLPAASALAQQGEVAPASLIKEAPKGAPNIVLVLLDDVGFGAASTFGGAAATPALEMLAK